MNFSSYFLGHLKTYKVSKNSKRSGDIENIMLTTLCSRVLFVIKTVLCLQSNINC